MNVIIDIHAHIAFNKIYPLSYLSGFIEKPSYDLGHNRISSILSLFLKDKYCHKLVRQMDEAGINKSVLLLIDGGIGLGEPEWKIEEILDLHLEVLKLYPDRFLVFAGMDPRRGESGLSIFKEVVRNAGVRGLKLYPPMGYSMEDKRLYEYYKICADNDLSVLIHTGPSLASLRNEFSDPECIYKVAVDFPTINFILAHAGYNLFDSPIHKLMALPNLFLDIAGFQGIHKSVDSFMIERMGMIFSECINRKIIFGTDWPLFNTVSSLRSHVFMIQELFEKVDDRINEGLDNVLYKNALRALKMHTI